MGDRKPAPGPRATGRTPQAYTLQGALNTAVTVIGGLAVLLTLVTGAFLLWALAGPGKTYVFAVSATAEWLEVEDVTHPAVSRVALLNAAGAGMPGPVTGMLLPREGTRVTFERRGTGPAKLAMYGRGSSAGQIEHRPAGELQADDLPAEVVFRVPFAASATDGGECGEKSRACPAPGTLRATLQGPLNLGEESAVANVRPQTLTAGTATASSIAVRMFGRSTLFPHSALYELGAFTLPPDTRVKPVEGERSLWSTSVVPAEGGGFSVEATTTARELRVFSAAGPTHGDSISAGFFAVLFNDPDIASLAASAAALGALSQLLELIRARLEERGKR